MEFKIPFSRASLGRLKKRAELFRKFIKQKKDTKLQSYLNKVGVVISREEYIVISLLGFSSTFLFVFALSFVGLVFSRFQHALLFSFGVAFISGFFVFFSRMIYPKIFVNRKQREIESNLIPALQDMLVQLTSGIPLFSIMVNISASDYGALSYEFKKIVQKLNAGSPQLEVLKEVAENNPSLFFRRALWQISNGMRAGSDISIVIRDSIKSLNEEQLVQIQNYGNKLNPSIMFYMLSSVILPALAITFLTVISSLINLGQQVTIFMFVGLFVLVVFIQIMFLGVIKSIRPSLLQG